MKKMPPSKIKCLKIICFDLQPAADEHFILFEVSIATYRISQPKNRIFDHIPTCYLLNCAHLPCFQETLINQAMVYTCSATTKQTDNPKTYPPAINDHVSKCPPSHLWLWPFISPTSGPPPFTFVFFIFDLLSWSSFSSDSSAGKYHKNQANHLETPVRTWIFSGLDHSNSLCTCFTQSCEFCLQLVQ